MTKVCIPQGIKEYALVRIFFESGHGKGAPGGVSSCQAHGKQQHLYRTPEALCSVSKRHRSASLGDKD